LGYVAGFLVATAVACGGATHRADPPVTDPTATTHGTTTTTAPAGSGTTTTLPRDADTLDLATPPVLRTGGDDFPSVVDQIVFYVDWVFHHPDVDALEKVYAEGGAGLAEAQANVQAYVDRGVKDRGDPTAVSGVKVLSTVDANHVTVYAVFTVPAYDVVDARTDTVVEHREGRPPAGWSYELARDPADPNAHWLVVSRTDLGELPG
jgi:hypothetical protein